MQSSLPSRSGPSERDLVAREERRLGAIFQRAMLIVIAGLGCSTKAADGVPANEDGGLDASTEAGSPDARRDAGPPDRCVASLYKPNPPDTCGDYYTFPCGLPAGLP